MENSFHQIHQDISINSLTQFPASRKQYNVCEHIFLFFKVILHYIVLQEDQIVLLLPFLVRFFLPYRLARFRTTTCLTSSWSEKSLTPSLAMILQCQPITEENRQHYRYLNRNDVSLQVPVYNKTLEVTEKTRTFYEVTSCHGHR